MGGSKRLEDALDSLQVQYILLVQMRILFKDGGGGSKEAGGRPEQPPGTLHIANYTEDREN